MDLIYKTDHSQFNQLFLIPNLVEFIRCPFDCGQLDWLVVSWKGSAIMYFDMDWGRRSNCWDVCWLGLENRRKRGGISIQELFPMIIVCDSCFRCNFHLNCGRFYSIKTPELMSFHCRRPRDDDDGWMDSQQRQWEVGEGKILKWMLSFRSNKGILFQENLAKLIDNNVRRPLSWW